MEKFVAGIVMQAAAEKKIFTQVASYAGKLL